MILALYVHTKWKISDYDSLHTGTQYGARYQVPRSSTQYFSVPVQPCFSSFFVSYIQKTLVGTPTWWYWWSRPRLLGWLVENRQLRRFAAGSSDEEVVVKKSGSCFKGNKAKLLTYYKNLAISGTGTRYAVRPASYLVLEYQTLSLIGVASRILCFVSIPVYHLR